MHIRPGAVQITAAVMWAGTITADVMQADDRVWVPLLAAALLASWAAVQQHLIDRASQAANAMTRAALTRPFYRDTGPIARVTATGPMRKLAAVSPQHCGEAVPASPASVLHRRHGQHVSQ